MKKKLRFVFFIILALVLSANHAYCQLSPSDKYHDVLQHSKFIGSWTSAELLNVTDSIKSILPFGVDKWVLKTFQGSPYIADPVNSIQTSHKVIPKGVFGNEWEPDSSAMLHISMWVDTSIGRLCDTLLSIVNARKFDSLDRLANQGFIGLRVKRPYIAQDASDTNGGQLEEGKILTAFVRPGEPENFIHLRLLSGDSVVIRLLRPAQSMGRLDFTIDFQNGTNADFGHGRVIFNQPLAGVKNIHKDFSAPSSLLLHRLGAPDSSHLVMYQDSLLYQNFHSGKSEKWRHHHWNAEGNLGICFANKEVIGPVRVRPTVICVDSIVHPVIIKTDLGGTGSGGVIGFKDPFLVDSATRDNVYDTLWKKSPFLSHTDAPGRMPGADSEHYGGVFQKENVRHNNTMPIYTLKASKILKARTLARQDTGMASKGDWVFKCWVSDDDISPNDYMPWSHNSEPNDLPLINLNPVTDVVFIRDSAQYIARYKRQ